MNVAVHIADFPREISERLGRAAVYYLDGHHWVFLSTVKLGSEHETYAFACDQHGFVTDWSELSMSRKGRWRHAGVLFDSGYEVVSLTPECIQAIDGADIALLAVLAVEQNMFGSELLSTILTALVTI